MNLFEKISYGVFFSVIFYNLGYYRGRSRGRSHVLLYSRKIIPNVDARLEGEEKRERLGYSPRN